MIPTPGGKIPFWCIPGENQSFVKSMKSCFARWKPRGSARMKSAVADEMKSVFSIPAKRDFTPQGFHPAGISPTASGFHPLQDGFRWKKHFCKAEVLFSGGRWWIRTTEVSDNRFTVCSLWPLGKSPIKSPRLVDSLELVIGVEPTTCWLQISCSAIEPHQRRSSLANRSISERCY